MIDERAGYVRFMALPPEWATEANIPVEMVLRRLSEWAVVGAFPPDAFITRAGTTVSPLEIFKRSMAVINKNSPVVIDQWAYHYDPQESLDFLLDVQVPVDAIRIFCERSGTLPPRSFLSGLRRWWVSRRADKQLAPPACPNAAQEVRRQSARENAKASLNSMTAILDGLQGRRRHVWGPRRTDGEPINFSYWGTEWTGHRERALDEVSRAEDETLQQQLAALDEQWAEFVAAETRPRPAPENRAEQVSEIQRNAEPQSLGADGNRDRRRGRPKGSGSYEAADAPLIEAMRAAILANPTLSPTAAALQVAHRAAGGGTDESKAKRLAAAYSAKFRE
jgi:hypothetical protein